MPVAAHALHSFGYSFAHSKFQARGFMSMSSSDIADLQAYACTTASSSSLHRSVKCSWAADRSLRFDAFPFLMNDEGAMARAPCPPPSISPEWAEYRHAIKAKSLELFGALGYIEPATL